jgi:hypothetical protein
MIVQASHVRDVPLKDRFRVVPCTLREANDFVRRHHRHHPPARGCKFTIAITLADAVVGVAVVGRPVSRHLDDGWTCEVTRMATNGTPNACSKLYGVCRRVAAQLGYRRLVTYTLPEEGGASLRAAGFRLVGLSGGGCWDREARPRVSRHPEQKKLRWELSL